MGAKESRQSEVCVFGARPDGRPVCFPTRPSRHNKTCQAAGHVACYDRQEMSPVLALLCGRKLTSSDDVKDCMERMHRISPSSYVRQMAAKERTHARAIDSGHLTLYEMGDFQRDLCARLPQEQCVDRGRGRALRCAWSEEGSDSSPEPVCGALLETSSLDGLEDSVVWSSHVGDNPTRVPRKPFQEDRALANPSPDDDFSEATYK